MLDVVYYMYFFIDLNVLVEKGVWVIIGVKGVYLCDSDG